MVVVRNNARNAHNERQPRSRVVVVDSLDDPQPPMAIVSLLPADDLQPQLRLSC